MARKTYIYALLACVSIRYAQSEMASCDSDIYCSGKLLHTIQMAQIYPDSKTFVDMELSHSPEKVKKNFRKLMIKSKNNPCKDQIESFVKANFQPGNELEEWKSPDFDPNPPFLATIRNETMRSFAQQLVPRWGTLGRIMKADVFKRPERYSIIPVPHGFVVPGGRFKEFYYWDSYWIIKGLLACGMHQTVRGMLDNFLTMVDRYGFIPNGGRIYYLNRSQPPLLNAMVFEYINATKDVEWLRKNLHLLEREAEYFLETQTVTFDYNGKRYKLSHYSVDSPSPRPESYIEDVRTCAVRPTEALIKECYKDLKSGAESGWDFSSRWIFTENGGFGANLTDIQTRRVIPVDLNSFLAQAFELVSKFAGMVGDEARKSRWEAEHKKWVQTIQDVLYDQEDGIWYDLDLKLLKHRKGFFPSNLTPLWSNLLQGEAMNFGERAVEYLERLGILNFQGGVPTSLDNTGEQWDLPNAWPPLQSIVVMGLKKAGGPTALATARKLADKWLNSNWRLFDGTGLMFEKYNAEDIGVSGGGGEYEIQTGFGWSNGVVFEFIEEFYT